jgi:spore coat-associated protein N
MRVAVTLALVVAAFAVALIDPHGSRAETARAMASGATGALSIANSGEGRAILDASGLRPGATVTGTVTIGNTGQVAGRFAVRPTGLADTPGAGGGALSQRLQLQLADVTANRVLYTGTPAGLSAIDVGDLAAGESRTFALTATFPPGADDDRYQGATVSFGLAWSATAAEPAVTATPTDTPAPVPPATAPTPTAPKKAAMADRVGLPPAKRCLGRQLRVHVRTPDHAKLVSAKLRAGHRTAKATARRPTAVLSRLPRGRVTVTLEVRTAAKHTYRASRAYKSCAKAR